MKVMRHHLDEMEPRYCAGGVRRWFARMGWDWSAFLRDGIEIEQVEATGDAMALKLAEYVRKQHGEQ